MSPQEIFVELSQDPILVEKYGISLDQLKKIEFHKPCKIEVLEIIRLILLANANNMSEINTFRQIKHQLGIN